MTERVDVAVIGAGPAGTTAATLAARAGLDVHVFDRAAFPRDKCCGDALTALALRELEALGLDPCSIDSWQVVDRVAVRSPTGREIRYRLTGGSGCLAAVARRADLDAAMVALARAAGATIHEGTALTDAHAAGGAVVLNFGTDREPVAARVVVAADGMWSPTRKALGLAVQGYRGESHAFRQYFRNVSERAAGELVVWFEPDLLPGYAWSFPLPDGRANVGFGIQRGRHAVGAMGRIWADLLARPHVRALLGDAAVAESPHRAWPIPARVGRLPLVGPRTMFVGDAAAATDPMTGEGIGQALLTGRLAAEALTTHDNPADLVNSYERRVRHELSADDRMARTLIPLLARPRIANAALRATGATPWIRRNFVRWMFEDYPRAMVATPRRWHRGAFAGPGVFADADTRARPEVATDAGPADAPTPMVADAEPAKLTLPARRR